MVAGGANTRKNSALHETFAETVQNGTMQLADGAETGVDILFSYE